MLNKFKFDSKASTLSKLKPILKRSTILKIYSFNRERWNTNKNEIIKKIKTIFNGEVIVRSSAIDEDTTKKSQAGKYLSLSSINSKNTKKLNRSINKVFKSYKNNNLKNEVLIQPMLKNVSSSGVLFTYDNETGSPYYCIEYDELTGFTDTVTAGSNDKSRTLYVLRSRYKLLKSTRFLNLINAVKEIEKATSTAKLDIEFGINKKNRIFIFQVRPLVINKIFNNKLVNRINKKIKNLEIFYKNNKKIKNSDGVNEIYGVMPDWNPAEIIGIMPRPLSNSLYSEIITDKVWSISRKNLGYKDVVGSKLMNNFASHPYINVNHSFNSFIPKNLSKSISKKIVNHWKEDIKKNNYKHDKIEFEICDTCFNFDTNKNLNRYKKILKNSEIKKFKKELIKLTDKLILNYKKDLNIYDNGLKSLEFKRKDLLKKKYISSKDLYSLIEYIKKYGTLNFANSARLAFIAENILRSLVSNKIFSIKRYNSFKNSIQTVLSDFVIDTNKLHKKKISWKYFCQRYGHLRSGTYDIESPRYDNSNYFDLKRLNHSNMKSAKKVIFNLKANEINKINKNLKKNKLSINHSKLIDFIRSSISFRELSKFIFTKSVSDLLEFIYKIGRPFKLTRESLSFLKISDLKLFDEKRNKNMIVEKVLTNKQEYNFNKYIKLPYLITQQSDFSIIPLLKGIPNFITLKKITKKTLYLKNKTTKILKNKILLIDHADPGYDWIFLYGIAGLVTKYGGANSHMAIRCAELNIPAVIGCGEQLFRKLSSSNLIEIDCLIKKIKIIN